MRPTLIAVTALLTSWVCCASARGQWIVDQQTSCDYGPAHQIQYHEPIAQRFTPLAPNVIAVEVFLEPFAASAMDTLTLELWQGGIGSTLVASTAAVVTYPPVSGWVRFEFPSPVAIAAAVPHVIELDATNDTWGWGGNYEVPPLCTYPGGEETLFGGPIAGLDAMFRTYTSCGDGVPDSSEQCDDGNTNPSDGCTNHCTVCGDDVVSVPEECDDGNLDDGDACDSNCRVTACGNDVVTSGETCDDGNLLDGDCCTSTCQYDGPGAACVQDPNECTDDVCDGAGTCTHPANTAPCSDGDPCNGTDTCLGGTCTAHAGDPCATATECRRNCVPSGLSYQCLVDPGGTACTDDGNACTRDECTGAGTCGHPSKADGTGCNDGDRCTTGDACAGGACQAGVPVVCDPCLACDGGSGSCVPPGTLGCQPAASGRATVVLRDNLDPERDRLAWKWTGSAGVDKSDFGTPPATTALTLCVFDQTGLKISATASAGGTCAGRPCWLTSPSGYRYIDSERTPDGLFKLQTRAGGAGQARVKVKGRGTNLGLPGLDLTAPVTVRLKRSDGPVCWEATYSTPIRSDAYQFRAKSD